MAFAWFLFYSFPVVDEPVTRDPLDNTSDISRCHLREAVAKSVQ